MKEWKQNDQELKACNELFLSEMEHYVSKKTTVEEIPVAELHPFKNNPFRIRDDLDMELLVQSVQENGVLYPIMARPRDGGGYEIISGHRRIIACGKAGIEKVPAFIRPMGSDEAVICLVDSNLHRDGLLPSETAFAYKTRTDAIRHQGTSRQVGEKLSVTKVSEVARESERQIHRYIRLTNLHPKLLELVDQRRMAFGPAVELSYLPKDDQQILVKIFEEEDVTPSFSQAVRMRKLSDQGLLSADRVYEIMAEPKANQKEYLRLSGEQYGQYLSRFQTPQEKTAFILNALDYYTRYLQRLRDRDR